MIGTNISEKSVLNIYSVSREVQVTHCLADVLQLDLIITTEWSDFPQMVKKYSLD
jgi:hypothetical protein